MSLAGRRCLVTGATGFIGWHLVQRLVEESAEVFCQAEPGVNTAELDSIEGISGKHEADITDAASVRDVVDAARPSLVFHLAAVGVSDPAVDPIQAVRVNVEGTLNLLVALDGCFDLFINTGTCHEYGEGEAPFRESLPPAPLGTYAASKVAAWHFCNYFCRTKEWPIATLRLFTVYGPRQAQRSLVPSVILSALRGEELAMTSGEQVRDFVYVEDIVDAYLLAAASPLSSGKTFNLCSGEGVSLRALVQKIESVAGALRVRFGSRPYRRGEQMNLIGDNSLARQTFGWEPTVDLEEGLRRTIQWYRQAIRRT
jgi:UDP-glucose 4-epimerase